MNIYILNDLILSKNQGINTTTEKIKYCASGHKVLRAKNILDNKIDESDLVYIDDNTYNTSNDNYKPKIDDVLYTNIGSQFGSACVLNTNDYFITWNILRLVPNKKLISPLYLSYLLNSNKERLRNLNSSSTMPFVSGNILCKEKFNIHSLEEQQHIVNTIGTIDDKIENNEKLINKIEEFLLLNFIKLDKCEGLVFSDIFNCFNGGTFKSTDYAEKSEYKLITIKNIDGNGFNTDNATYIPKMDKYAKYKLKIGDILLTMTGAYLGRSGIVDEENCYLNQRVLKISGISKSFLYCFLKYNQNEIFNLGKGSAQPNLSLSDLNCFPVNYDINDINSFCENDKYIDLIINLKIETRKLKTLKAQFLTKFFN